jgi:hypothetical protein
LEAKVTEKEAPPPEIAAVFDSLPPDIAYVLRAVRLDILNAAGTTAGVGQLIETLKWGEPAYLTEAPKTSTTLRLGRIGGQAAVMVPCSTTIIEDARAIFGDVLELSGKRGLILGGDAQMLAHVIHAALTYHMRKRR